ncbi:MAG: ribbon-helix-helix protein, CopG family [Promethearchaeota archaeon]
MSTTIQIKKKTLEKLKRLKRDQKAKTYDEVIDNLILNEDQVPDSLFGYLKGKMTPYARDEMDEDHEL